MSDAQLTGGQAGAAAPLSRIGKLGDKWHWRINRILCMSRREIGYRARQAVWVQLERLGSARARQVPAPDLGRSSSRLWVNNGVGIDSRHYVAAADRLAQGRIDIFALKDVELGDPPAWNRNLKSGIDAPLEFGKTLDYRVTGISGEIGSVKYLWEPNRHLHLVTLAQAYCMTGDERYLHIIRRHLDTWFAACPFPMGANWSSALEPAIRLLNWSVTWQLIGGADSTIFAGQAGQDFRLRWLAMIHLHADFIHGYFSQHSSANNHLIGEAAGVFVAGLTWPYWERAATWADTGRAILEREIRLQNFADGVNCEQAVSYQQFVLDLLIVSGLSARASGRVFAGTGLLSMPFLAGNGSGAVRTRRFQGEVRCARRQDALAAGREIRCCLRRYCPLGRETSPAQGFFRRWVLCSRLRF
jgi:hypothetical protein